MTKHQNHVIEVKTNIADKFSRKIILITGNVQKQCEQQFIEIQTEDKNNRKISLFKGTFKVLIKLTRNNLNRLKMKYCESELELLLQHESIDPIYYEIQPLYIIPKNHNGDFQTDRSIENSKYLALDKIDLMMELAQCVISSKIYEFQQQELSFVVQKCQFFNSNLNATDVLNMNQWSLYDKIAQELLDKFGADIVKTKKFVGFVSCTKYLGLSDNEDYNYANIKNKTLANPSLGNGFLAILGNGCFYALPNDIDEVIEAFQNKTKVDVTKLLDDSNYKGTYGGCFSTFLGSLIHEIGHIFDLGHTATGIMGTDIDYVHRFFLCENVTEMMPKRIISNCQQIEKNTEITTNRITKIKKNGIFMEKYHEQKNKDLTQFELNCLITLMSHKWFTQNTLDFCISYVNRTIESKESDIILIEIRELDIKNSMLKKFFDLRNKNLRQFVIPSEEVLEKVTLIAINTHGSILKKVFE